MTCIVEQCDGPVRAKGLCGKHYQRKQKHGDVTIVKLGCTAPGELSFRWKGVQVGYRAAHNRIEKARGRATDQICVDCGRQADQWSYDHADLDEQRTPAGLPYSSKPEHYLPRCCSCHTKLDRYGCAS